MSKKNNRKGSNKGLAKEGMVLVECKGCEERDIVPLDTATLPYYCDACSNMRDWGFVEEMG
jgi:ribosomal protein S27E